MIRKCEDCGNPSGTVHQYGCSIGAHLGPHETHYADKVEFLGIAESEWRGIISVLKQWSAVEESPLKTLMRLIEAKP